MRGEAGSKGGLVYQAEENTLVDFQGTKEGYLWSLCEEIGH